MILVFTLSSMSEKAITSTLVSKAEQASFASERLSHPGKHMTKSRRGWGGISNLRGSSSAPRAYPRNYSVSTPSNLEISLRGVDAPVISIRPWGGRDRCDIVRYRLSKVPRPAL